MIDEEQVARDLGLQERKTMRRPKHKEIRGSADCITHSYTSHGNKNTVTVEVTELETGPHTGTLVVELLGVKGNVRLHSATDTEVKKELEALSSVVIRARDILKDEASSDTAKQVLSMLETVLS